MSAPSTDLASRQGGASRGEQLPAVELPSLLLALAVYTGWLAISLQYRRWPLWIVAPAMILVLTLHSSVQHEFVHGHPTRWRRFNRLLGIVPLSLWLPYTRYQQNHLAHHRDQRLTDPLDDPESFYWTEADWARLGPVTRALLWVQQTLAGRVIVGAFWTIGSFWRGELRHLFRRGEAQRRWLWIEHLLWCVPVLFWLTRVCLMPLWIYALLMVIPANGVLLIRSFAEHRARPGVRQRIAIVEGSWLLGPLFLFNNLHALHHESPQLPWYRYHRRYRLHRKRLIAENGGLVYSSYLDVARRYLFRPHDLPLHPMGRVPTAQAGRS